MRVTIVFIAIFGLCCGQSGNSSSPKQCVPPLWIFPTAYIIPCMSNEGHSNLETSGNPKVRGSVNDGQTVDTDEPTEDKYHNAYLKVCQPPVSKSVEMDVQASLESSTDLADRLAQAIDEMDSQGLLQLVSDCKTLLPEKNAGIEGATMAAINGAEGINVSNDQRRCTQRILGQLQLFFKLMKEVMRQTAEALVNLKKDIKVDNLIKYSEYFKAFLVQLEQFLADPSQDERLQNVCTKENNTQLMISIVDDLEKIAADVKKKGDEIKAEIVLSTTGLLSQAIAFNAVCHGVENYDQSDMKGEQVLANDTDLSTKLADKLELTIRDILKRKSIFKRFLGY